MNCLPACHTLVAVLLPRAELGRGGGEDEGGDENAALHAAPLLGRLPGTSHLYQPGPAGLPGPRAVTYHSVLQPTSSCDVINVLDSLLSN